MALLDEVTVIVEALCEPEPDEEPLPDEEDEPDDEPPPPPPPPNTLAEADMEPRVVPRLPLMLPRLPRSCGAMIAENRSAVITPVTRSVRCTSPAAITAVRTTVPPGPPPSFGARRSRFRYRPAPAAITAAAKPNHRARGRGRGGTGLTILGPDGSGRDGARCGRAPPRGFGRGEALLISKRMFFVQTTGRSM